MKTTGSIKIEEKTLDRLRKHVATKFEGKMWGHVSSETEIALNQYLDREEKALEDYLEMLRIRE